MSNVQIVGFGVSLLAATVLLFGVWIFVAFRWLEKIESFFSNSRMVLDNKQLYFYAGVFGRLLRLGSISVMLSVKSFSIRKGMLDVGDVYKAPIGLIRSLVGLWFFHMLLFIVFAVFCFWLRFRT